MEGILTNFYALNLPNTCSIEPKTFSRLGRSVVDVICRRLDWIYIRDKKHSCRQKKLCPPMGVFRHSREFVLGRSKHSPGGGRQRTCFLFLLPFLVQRLLQTCFLCVRCLIGSLPHALFIVAYRSVWQLALCLCCLDRIIKPLTGLVETLHLAY